MDALLGPLKDLLGGGVGTLWMVGGGLLLIWLAFKIVKFTMKVLALGVGVALLLSAAPWASDGVDAPAAECARQAVEDAMTTVESIVAKRVTIKVVSDDARCNGDKSGLASGTATARLRTFYDLPIQEYAVDREGATPRFDVPDVPNVPIPGRSSDGETSTDQ